MILTLSYSSCADARSCLKKFHYRNILGLALKQKGSALSIGSTIHQCFDMYFNKKTQPEILQHIHDSYKALSAVTSNPIDQERMLVDKYACLGMWVNYPFQDMEFEEVFPERPFTIKLDGLCGVYITGTVDGLVRRVGKWWIREVKTTSMDKRQFQSKASVSYQAAGYIYGIEKMLGLDIQGVLYDVISKNRLRKGVNETAQGFAERIYADYARPDKKDQYYDRYYSYRSIKEIVEYEKDMVALAKELRLRIKHNIWYRNTEACYLYNSECPYKKICWEERPDQGLLDSLYEQGGGDVLCPKCGHDRWKTITKHVEYRCRKCGFLKRKEPNEPPESQETTQGAA